MNCFTPTIEPPADAPFAAQGITIIYEDRLTGLSAKRFSDMLAASLGGEHSSTPACWRVELIELPEIAAEITCDAAASEFVVLSLRGDTGLSMATRIWIESWLAKASEGSTNLIALFDPKRSRRGPAEGTRLYLRQAAADAGVAFFAHFAIAPGRVAAGQFSVVDDEAPAPKRRRRFRKDLNQHPAAHQPASIAA